MPLIKDNKRKHHSTFRCTGAENDIESWQDRLCIFNDICYNNDAQRFEYYPLFLKEKRPIFYDANYGMLFQFGMKNDGSGFLSLSSGGGQSWAPVIINETYPVRNMTRLSRLHTIWADALGASNIGHGLWEDLGSISYSMERLNEFDPQLVIMHKNKIPETAIFRSYQQYIIPALTETPMVEFGTYIRSFKTKFVCFEKVFAGGQLSVFKPSIIKENHGREPLFYNWRSKIISKNGFDPEFIPNKHKIVITNKSYSQWTNPASNRHRAIANLKEVVNFIRKSYPTIDTEVVEWQNIPFNKQIEKLLITTILITPCGGVSLIIPLLPRFAHAIVMDYYATHDHYGFKRGQSASMEGAFLNHFPHVRKHYYQVYGSQDFEFDFPGAKDTRNDASIIVNTTRLQLLIDTALEDMHP